MLQDELTKLTNFECVVARWIDTLEPKDVETLKQAIELHGPWVSYRAAKNYTYRGSESSFLRHFKGLCRCQNAL